MVARDRLLDQLGRSLERCQLILREIAQARGEGFDSASPGAREQSPALRGRMNPLDAPILGIGSPTHQACAFEPGDDTADRRRPHLLGRGRRPSVKGPAKTTTERAESLAALIFEAASSSRTSRRRSMAADAAIGCALDVGG